MVRWPGKIKPGSVSNDIVAHLDWLPTFVAMAGDTQVKDELLKGYKVGDTTYKVHLDGDNLVPYLTGQVANKPSSSTCGKSAIASRSAGVPGSGDQIRLVHDVLKDFPPWPPSGRDSMDPGEGQSGVGWRGERPIVCPIAEPVAQHRLEW